MPAPAITVLIDTHNHERFIEQAIESVLEQDFPRSQMEILVVDDGSTDRTPELVRKFEPQVRLIRKANGGQASAFNAGIPQAAGEIIAFLDGDDWWAREKLARVWDVMRRERTIGMVGHGIWQREPGLAPRRIAVESVEGFRLDSTEAARAFRLRRCYLGTSRLALRSELARQLLPVPEALVFEADEYLFTLAAIQQKFAILPDALTFYRIHDANLFVAPRGNDAEKRKYRVLAALESELRRAFARLGVSAETAAPLLEIAGAESERLRLKVEGGSPLDAYRTEQTLFRIHHPEASLRQRAYHEVMMLPSLVLPPRWFYGARAWLTTRSWYSRAREALLPVPAVTSVSAPESALNLHASEAGQAGQPEQRGRGLHRVEARSAGE